MTRMIDRPRKDPPAAPRRGEKITATFLSELVNSIKRAQALPATRTTQVGDETGPGPKGDGASGGVELARMQITSIGLDTWTCTNLETSAVGISVAKVDWLRGIAAEQRIVSGQVQDLIPRVLASPSEPVIHALKVSETTTGIAGVIWQDITPRFWASNFNPFA